MKRTHPNTNSTQNLRNTINSIKALIKADFKKSIDAYWQNLAKQIDHTKPDKFFPVINRIFRERNTQKIDQLKIPLEEVNLLHRAYPLINNTLPENNFYTISNPSDKLNVIGAFYESINSPRYLNQNTQHKQSIDELANTISNELAHNKEQKIGIMNFNINNPANNPNWNIDTEGESPFCDAALIRIILKKTPNKLSSGPDSIPSIVLKHLPEKIIDNLVILFNNMLNNFYFPIAWKTANVIPLIKKGKDPHHPSSYRPISMTNTISKIYEKIINRHLINYSYELKLIPDNQFGFRHNHSTVHAIHKLLNDTYQYLNNGLSVGATLIDLEKAFDSVWINGLIATLYERKIPKWLILNILDMISNKKFNIWRNSHEKSTLEFTISEGLQQGTVNSPILFNIYPNAIIKGVNISNYTNADTIAFADDLIIYVAGNYPVSIQRKLNHLVNAANDCFQKWNLRINPAKCESILFRKPRDQLSKAKRDQIKEFSIKTTNPNTMTLEQIPTKPVVKYLGVHIDYLLRLNKHVDIQLEKAKNAIKANNGLFKSRSLSIKAKTICYQLLIRSILTYAAPVWWNISASLAEKLRIFERTCLRPCLGKYYSTESSYKKRISNLNIYKEANITRIDNFIIKLTRDYLAKLIANHNPTIKKLAFLPKEAHLTALRTGYISPQTFTFCDINGIIQNEDNIPTIYHWRRNKANKKIPIELDLISNPGNFQFSTALPPVDILDDHRLQHKKYFWLKPNNKSLILLRDNLTARSRATIINTDESTT